MVLLEQVEHRLAGRLRAAEPDREGDDRAEREALDVVGGGVHTHLDDALGDAVEDVTRGEQCPAREQFDLYLPVCLLVQALRPLLHLHARERLGGGEEGVT